MNDITREQEPKNWKKAAEILDTIVTSIAFSQEEVSGIPPEARKYTPGPILDTYTAALATDFRRSAGTSNTEHVKGYQSFLSSPYSRGYDGEGTVWPLALHISAHRVPPSDDTLSSPSLQDANDRSSVTLAEDDLPMPDANQCLLFQTEDYQDGSVDQKDENVRAMATLVTSDEEMMNLASSNKAASSIHDRIRPCPEGYIWSNMLPTAWQYLAEQSGQPIECIFSIVKCYKALASYTTSSIRCPFPGRMYVFEPHPDECNFEPHFMWHRVMGHTLERCYCAASPTDLSLHFVYWHFDWSVNCPFCLGDIAAVGSIQVVFRFRAYWVANALPHHA